MSYGHSIPNEQLFPVLVTTTIELTAERAVTHFDEREMLLNLGLSGNPGERLLPARFRLWVSQPEREQLRSRVSHGTSPGFIGSVEDDDTAHKWQYREGAEYLVENRLTFRLRAYIKYETYNNHYVVLELLTNKGWTELGNIYCGDTYHGIEAGRRQAYESLRRQAETLVELGATIASDSAAIAT